MFSPITTLYTYFPLQFFVRITIDLLIMAFGVVLAFKLYKKSVFDKAQRAACVMLFIWGAVVLLFTVLGRRSDRIEGMVYNLKLFSCYQMIFFGHDKTMLISVLQNILMFVPIGFTLAVIFRKNRIWIVIAISFCLSLFIEISQFLLQSGFFETDDLFNNTMGAVIGIIICYLCSLIFKTIKKNHRKEDIFASKSHR